MTRKLKLLDLFSGIGGFSLGLERTGGFETAAFCEIEEFPRRVLKKNWPEVPCYADIRKLTAAKLAADGIAVDAISAGYPCQGESYAGKRKGADDDRWLWPEVDRLIGEIRPRVFFGENVAGHVTLGLDQVLSDLEARGYAAGAFIIPACAVGAWHRRDRVWIIAHSQRDEQSRQEPCERALGRMGRVVKPVAWNRDWQDTFSALRGSGDGVSRSVDRTDGLRNAVVPQIPEMLGNAWLASCEVSA